MSDSKQLIECTAGAAETSIAGTGYRFERDRYGRFVAEVHNLVHRACLLSVVHYRAVPDHPPIEETAPGLGALRSDGPTVEEYVAAGYLAVKYPPNGYASRSTAEEIEAAIAAQSAAANLAGSGNEGQNPEQDPDAGSEGSEDGENSGSSDTDTGNGDTGGANADTEAANSDSGTAQPETGSAPATDAQQSARRRR
ncbi:hypothetical protein I6F11_04020 [Ensifer sp. NBAIM29]|nr:hypothetical protein [Ensifer sp. NBAIM29]